MNDNLQFRSTEMTKKRINARIKDTGLTVEGTRGDGYFYFIDAIGNQVGESVYVYYLNRLSLDEWAYEAQQALASAPSHPLSMERTMELRPTGLSLEERMIMGLRLALHREGA